MRKLVVLALVVACGGSQKPGENSENFAKQFYSNENIASYIETIDALLREADEKRYAGLADMQAAEPPKARTANGVLIIATVLDMDQAAAHHVSFSHASGLATPFARFIAALVAKRGAYPVPDAIVRSQNGVYHVEWIVPHNLRDKLRQVRDKAAEVTDPMQVGASAAVEGARMRIQSMTVPGR